MEICPVKKNYEKFGKKAVALGKKSLMISHERTPGAKSRKHHRTLHSRSADSVLHDSPHRNFKVSCPHKQKEPVVNNYFV